MIAQLSFRVGVDHAEFFSASEGPPPYADGLKQPECAMPPMRQHPVACVASVLRHPSAAGCVSDGVHALDRDRGTPNRDARRSDEVADLVQVALWICLQVLVKQQQYSVRSKETVKVAEMKRVTAGFANHLVSRDRLLESYAGPRVTPHGSIGRPCAFGRIAQRYDDPASRNRPRDSLVRLQDSEVVGIHLAHGTVGAATREVGEIPI